MLLGMALSDLLTLTPFGLYCPEADFYIDPVRAVPRAARPASGIS